MKTAEDYYQEAFGKWTEGASEKVYIKAMESYARQQVIEALREVRDEIWEHQESVSEDTDYAYHRAIDWVVNLIDQKLKEG